jgi:hypothetical protein
MNPIDNALLAVVASIAGDTNEANRHLETARQHASTAARRHRQIVEIAGLVIAGADDRAEGLALVHAAEFPDDTELLTSITRKELDET